MNLKTVSGLILCLSALFSSGPNYAQALAIDFESAFNSLGYQGDPAQFYIPQGLTISGVYFGLLEGVSRGDSGNFDLEGTAGPASLAVNTLGQTIDLKFDCVLSSFSFDLGTAFFSQSPGSPDITISTYRGTAQQSSELITIEDTLQGGNGTWYPKTFSGVDRVLLEATSGWRIWAIDNLQLTKDCSDPAPTPSNGVGYLPAIIGLLLSD